MIRFFMPMSGNLGDTLNVMPMLAGIKKYTGHKIALVVRDKMKAFNGFREFMEMQDPIQELKFESEVNLDSTYNTLSLVDDFPTHEIRPYETIRFQEFLKRNYSMNIDPDDDFMLNAPEPEEDTGDKFIVGDRSMSSMGGDERRVFDVLRSSGKFPVEKCHFLDYNKPVAYNAALIKATKKPIFTTFTGASNIADLLGKRTVVLWGDDLRNWDNKPIEYSFNKHFYRNRNCKLAYLGDFSLKNYEV